MSSHPENEATLMHADDGTSCASTVENDAGTLRCIKHGRAVYGSGYFPALERCACHDGSCRCVVECSAPGCGGVRHAPDGTALTADGKPVRSSCTDDLTATLEKWRKTVSEASRSLPWHETTTEEDVPVVCIDGPAPGSATVLFEADWGTLADARFIVTARAAMPVLLAAVEAILAKADEWEEGSFRLDVGAAVMDRCAKELREAITRELTDKGCRDAR